VKIALLEKILSTGGLLLCDVVEGDIVAVEEGGNPQQQQHAHLLGAKLGQLPQHLVPRVPSHGVACTSAAWLSF
jgi:hypothetical protein